MLSRRGERLHGEVSLAVPVSWQVFGGFLLLSLLVSLFFVATAHYARSEFVNGSVVLDSGVAGIVPSRTGVVTEVSVREGQQVEIGARLVSVKSEEDLAEGRAASDQLLVALTEQDGRLAQQATLVLEGARADRQRQQARIDGASQEIVNLGRQIDAQERLIELAESEYEKARAVAQRGFISLRDLQVREATLLARRQELAQLQQLRSAKHTDISDTQRSIAQSRANAEAQVAGVHSSRAQLAQRLAEVEATKGYTIVAPVAGRATAVTARVGQAVSPDDPLMMIIPDGAQIQAELYVPSQAAGFLAVGQDVRLAIDAFPFERFGTVAGEIAEISSVAMSRSSSDGGSKSVYLVTVNLRRSSIEAFGTRQPLLPGMTLSARIITERQTLLEYLFEPLYSVAQR